MFYLLSLLWLLSVSGLLVIIFKYKFEMVLTLSMIIAALCLYPFGYINHLSYGYYLSWLLVFIFFIIIGYWFFKKDYDKLKKFKNNYFRYN